MFARYRVFGPPWTNTQGKSEHLILLAGNSIREIFMPVRIDTKAIRREPLKPALVQKTRRRRTELKAEVQLVSRAPTPRNDLQPKLITEDRPIASLRMPERQVRKLGPDDIAKVT